MKKAGIVILAIGLLMTIYTGITYMTTETVVDAGPVQITRDDEHSVNWQPYVGFGLMLLGGAALMFGRKRALAV